MMGYESGLAAYLDREPPISVAKGQLERVGLILEDLAKVVGL